MDLGARELKSENWDRTGVESSACGARARAMGPLWHSAVGSETVARILEGAVDGPRHRFSQNFVSREDLTKTPDALRRAPASRDANVVPRAAAAVFRPAQCDATRRARRPEAPCMHRLRPHVAQRTPFGRPPPLQHRGRQAPISIHVPRRSHAPRSHNKYYGAIYGN